MPRILSEITPGLAAAFRFICSMSIWIMPLNENREIQGGVRELVVPYNKNDKKFRENGVSFNVLNELETLGVIRFESITGYISKGFTNDKILICVGDKLDLIEEYKKGELPVGNVMLTSVGKALKAITDPVEVKDYYEMVRKYMSDKGVKFATEHEFVAKVNGNELTINRKNP